MCFCTCRQVPTMSSYNIDDTNNEQVAITYPISFSAFKMSSNFYQLTWETTFGYNTGVEIQIRNTPEEEFEDYLILEGLRRGIKTPESFTNNPDFRIRTYIIQPGNPTIYSEWLENS